MSTGWNPLSDRTPGATGAFSASGGQKPDSVDEVLPFPGDLDDPGAPRRGLSGFPQQVLGGLSFVLAGAAQDVGDVRQREDLLAVLAGQDVLYGVCCFLVLRGSGAGGVDDTEVMGERVSRGLGYAVVGRHSGEHDRVHVPVPQAQQQVTYDQVADLGRSCRLHCRSIEFAIVGS